MYRCEAVSAEAFVQQLACNLVNHGYWFYTVGHVPPGKDPRAVDRKLIDGYGLEISKWQRARLKAKGHAKLSYLRHERFFVILATAGEHIFYQREGRVRDVRREPIVFDGYSIGCSKGSRSRSTPTLLTRDGHISWAWLCTALLIPWPPNFGRSASPRMLVFDGSCFGCCEK
jgi:hypothetical protein